MVLQAIKYERGSLQLLDQRKLPLHETWTNIPNVEAAWHAIKDMAVRGAPAIAIAAALALAVDLATAEEGHFASAKAAFDHIQKHLDYLVTSRPTAVNLFDAAHKLSNVARRASKAPEANAQDVISAVVTNCEAMLQEDVQANKALGQYGLESITAAVQGRSKGKAKKLRILTHCNTGSLATAEYGTALGVIRAAAEADQLEHAYCTETRPYNQGSRLTAYELVHDKLPATLIVDSAAAALMAHGQVDAVMVGADRVAANGDTANKIGTYSLAVAAKYHNIPFFIAAPVTTLDSNLPSGAKIVIEHRPGSEITSYNGQQIAAEGIEAWNPAFDITPAALIEAIITDKGVLSQKNGVFDIPGFLQSKGQPNGADDPHVEAGSEIDAFDGAPGQEEAAAGSGVYETNGKSKEGIQSTIKGFQALHTETVKDYLAERPDLAARLGPSSSKSSWKVQEVGDGNINFVYIVTGPNGAVCLKQGLPFVRIAQDWPLTQDRVRYEADALREQHRLCPEHVPAVYHFDPQNALIVMQYLPPPHVILRKSIVQGAIYPKLAGHIANFLAQTLFKTSLIALPTDQYRALAERFRNGDMCRLTEQVIFTDPYYDAPVNKHCSPKLDSLVLALRTDTEAKVVVSGLKAKFVERAQALLHGDMHTGSLMVTQDTTYAIDAEFAVYGPIAFDVGKFIANLLLAFFALDGHSSQAQPRKEQRTWLVQLFKANFLKLWDEQGSQGDAYPEQLFGQSAPQGRAATKAAQDAFMKELFQDALNFGGAVMIRRLVGIAHIDDFRDIPHLDARVVCETRALKFGRRLLVDKFADIQQVVQEAEQQRQDQQLPCF